METDNINVDTKSILCIIMSTFMSFVGLGQFKIVRNNQKKKGKCCGTRNNTNKHYNVTAQNYT